MDDVNKLKYYFAPKPLGVVTVLPNPKEVIDWAIVILDENGSLSKHQMINGKWYKIADLTED